MNRTKPTPTAAPHRFTPWRSSSQETPTSIKEMDEVSAANNANVKKAPPIKSLSAYYNWKNAGFPGFVPPPDEDLKGKE